MQDVTNQIVNEKGDPQTWPWTQYQGSDMNSSGNKEIAQYYKDKLKIGIDCCDDNRNGSTAETACYIPSTQYKYLNGNLVTLYRPFGTKYVFTLNDGVTIGIDFNQTRTGVMWGYTSLVFTIDVNGKRGPNQVGRDLFYLYLDKNKKGKIQTYVESYNSVDRFNRDNCKSGMSGYSCGEKIITEGGMFY